VVLKIPKRPTPVALSHIATSFIFTIEQIIPNASAPENNPTTFKTFVESDFFTFIGFTLSSVEGGYELGGNEGGVTAQGTQVAVVVCHHTVSLPQGFELVAVG